MADEHVKSVWRRASAHLDRARAFLTDPQDDALVPFVEFQDHNELGHALNQMADAAQAQRAPRAAWKELSAAAVVMKLGEADSVHGKAVRLINEHLATDALDGSAMGGHDALLAEIRQLHAKLDRLQRTQIPLRHAWVKHILHDFEYDPKVQYKVHLVAMWVWTFSMITVVCLFTFANHFWQIVSVLYLVLISLYANWATDYGAMSAALAAQQESPLPEVPLETHVEPSAEVGQ